MKGGTRFVRAPGSRTRNKITQGQNLPSLSGTPTGKGLHTARTTMGPFIVGIGVKPEQQTGPGEPPEGFVIGSTSKTEWYFYWALEKVLGPPGYETWEFQQSMQGGRSMLGGSVVDFVIYQPTRMIGVRLQTYRFHLSASVHKQAHDYEQYLALSSPDLIVIDVFEDDIIHDDTGQDAIKIVLEVISGQERLNPLATGLVVGTG